MATEENASKFDPPEENYPATEAQQVLIDFLREKWDTEDLTDLQCLLFARRHEVDKDPKAAITAGVEEYLRIVGPIKHIHWNSEIEKEEEIAKLMPIFAYGQDNQGHPVFYAPISEFNVTELNKPENMEAAKLHYIRNYLRMFHFNEIMTKETGNLQYECTYVLDFSGVGVWSMMKHQSLLSSLTGDLTKLYPEVGYKSLLINTPGAVSWITNLVKPLLGIRTQEKMRMDNGQAVLDEFIPKNQRIQKYGGISEIPQIPLTYTCLTQDYPPTKEEEDNFFL